MPKIDFGRGAAFPKGTGNGHHLINKSAAIAFHLELGSRNSAVLGILMQHAGRIPGVRPFICHRHERSQRKPQLKRPKARRLHEYLISRPCTSWLVPWRFPTKLGW